MATSAPLQSFIGGVKLPFFFANWGWPSARMVVWDEHMAIAPSAVVFRLFLVPTRAYTPRDVQRIELVGQWPTFQGIRIVPSQNPRKWVIFWTFRRQQVVDALSRNGFEVTVSPTPISYFRGITQ